VAIESDDPEVDDESGDEVESRPEADAAKADVDVVAAKAKADVDAAKADVAKAKADVDAAKADAAKADAAKVDAAAPSDDKAARSAFRPAVPEPPPGVTVLRTIDGAIGVVEHAIVAFTLGALILVGAASAVASNFFQHSIVWSFEAIRYSVFFIAMFGAALAAQSGKLISMDIVSRLVRPRVRAYLRFLTGVFTLAMCWFLVKGGWMLHESFAGETTYELIKPSIGVLALPIGAGLIAFHVFVRMIIDGLYLKAGVELPEDAAPSAH
jgi:TRAP-type C4-dicarboxylate transport system permease small subunit